MRCSAAAFAGRTNSQGSAAARPRGSSYCDCPAFQAHTRLGGSRCHTWAAAASPGMCSAEHGDSHFSYTSLPRLTPTDIRHTRRAGSTGSWDTPTHHPSLPHPRRTASSACRAAVRTSSQAPSPRACSSPPESSCPARGRSPRVSRSCCRQGLCVELPWAPAGTRRRASCRELRLILHVQWYRQCSSNHRCVADNRTCRGRRCTIA